MVRNILNKHIDANLEYCEYSGLSTDTKPSENLATGSVFLEVDTGDVYLYDEASEEWNKVGGE